MSNHEPLSKANCCSEDGELKEVIYGRIDDFVLPAYDPAIDFTGPRLVQLMKDHPATLPEPVVGGRSDLCADLGWFVSVAFVTDAYSRRIVGRPGEGICPRYR